MVAENRWAFDVELLLLARTLGLAVMEIPVVWADQVGSRLRLVSTTRDIVQSLLRMWWKRGHRVSAVDWDMPPSLDGRAGAIEGMALRILALNWRCLEHPQAGGAELNLFEQARRWSRDGHHVTVFCAEHSREQAVGRAMAVDDVTVVQRGGRFSVYLHAAIYLLRSGHHFDRVLDVANGIPFFTPLFVHVPVTLLVHHVHDQQWFSEFSYPIAAAGRFIERWVVPTLYRHCPVITVSPTTRDALIASGFAPSQLSVIFNGITRLAGESVDRRAKSRDQQGQQVTALAARRRRVAYVGRLKRYKRLDRLVAAVAVLRREIPDIHLDIVGDGDARAPLQAQIDALGLQHNVTLHGFVDEVTKERILRWARVFATPSMHEGWGLSVIEANAQGCPAIAYDVPGLRVAIQHEKTGLLATDDAAFQRALQTLLTDNFLRERYAANARKWATNFDWETSARQTLRVLYQGHTEMLVE